MQANSPVIVRSGGGEGTWVPLARTVITFGLLVAICNRLYYFTNSIGLPQPELGTLGFAYLIFGQTLVTVLHELGHLAAALAVGFRFNAINAGPVTVVRDALGQQAFHFDISRIFRQDGFVGAVPREESNLRSNMMALTFAGPFLSLNLGALLFMAMLSTPGTAAAPYGAFFGYLSVIFFLDFAVNMIPIGHCDGSMILHLALDTAKGQQIIDSLIAAMHSDRAELASSVDSEISSRRMAITAAQKQGTQHSLQTALDYLQLAKVELRTHALQEARTNCRTSLEILDLLPARAVHAVHKAMAQDTLARTYAEMGFHADAASAGDHALSAYIEGMSSAPGMGGLLEIHVQVADLQFCLRRFSDAIKTVENALRTLPGVASYPAEVAKLRRIRLSAILRSAPAAGRAIGSELGYVVDALRNPAMFADVRLAATEMGALAVDLWEAGNEVKARELMRDALQRFDAAGARAEASQLRVRMAALLIADGHLVEADALLTTAGGGPMALPARAELARLTKHREQALAAYSELMRLQVSEFGSAHVKVSLALLYESMNQAEEACQWAREACDVLVPQESAHASAALFLLARALWSSGNAEAGLYFEEGRRLVNRSTEHPAAMRARQLEVAALAFEQKGLRDAAAQLREDALAQRQQIPSFA